MSLRSLKSPLRHAVLATLTAGAICLPATTAFADTTPQPSAPPTATPSAAPSTPSATPSAGSDRGPSAAPGGGHTGVKTPRGGVAAGEQPEAAPADGSTVTVGAAAGAALLLAGATTVVVRRRTANRHDG